ncbi:hypothetical protein BJ085DRAFT_37377 [Dimargaris cristalligena]|uniref:SAM domain-containing protein n=1 Tax=Dimargaris cristalligena TaxID=215637 RepID=A0A4P9ZUK3_9FUNG|nr:hypothetical protein BJ085DRAFT_37377 [Dimargaris cristalligena]|eukprot:RKP37227.1 hypothetical protein BJ085DRAFT_37377 [Dimargaris cristalligena]
MAFQPPSRAVPVVQPVSTASRLDHIHPSRWSVDDVHYYFANTARQGGIATILRNLKVDGPTLLGYNNREAAVQTLGLKSYPQRTRYFECLQKLITQYNLPQPPKEKPPKGSKSATPPSDQATSKWTKRKRHRDLSLRCALADTAVKAAGVSKGPNAASITATCPPLVKPDPNRDILARSSPARHNPTKRRLTEPEPRPGQLTGSTKGKSSSHSPRSTKSSTPRNHPTANHLASTGKVNTGRAKTYMWSVKPIDGKVQQVTLSPSPNPTSTSNGSPVEAGSDRTKHSHSSADLTVETPHDKTPFRRVRILLVTAGTPPTIALTTFRMDHVHLIAQYPHLGLNLGLHLSIFIKLLIVSPRIVTKDPAPLYANLVLDPGPNLALLPAILDTSH